MPRDWFFHLATAERERLLAVAARHFAKSGFGPASLNEILAEAGLSKGVYYYYFDDKDDLFATVMESALTSMLAHIPLPKLTAISRDDFWPALERLVQSWAAAFSSSRDLMQAAAQLTEAQRASPRFAPLLHKLHGVYRVLVEKGQRLGCVRKDLPLEVLVRLLEVNDAVLDTALLPRVKKIGKAAIDGHVKLVLDTFRRLLEARPEGARPGPSRKPARRG